MKLTFQEHSLLAGLYIVDGRSTYKRTEVAMPNFDRELVPLLAVTPDARAGADRPADVARKPAG